MELTKDLKPFVQALVPHLKTNFNVDSAKIDLFREEALQVTIGHKSWNDKQRKYGKKTTTMAPLSAALLAPELMSIEIQCREVARLRADLVAATDAEEVVVVKTSDDHNVVPSGKQMLAVFGDESSNFLTSLNAAYKLIQTTGNYDWQPRVLEFRQVRQARSYFDGTSL